MKRKVFRAATDCLISYDIYKEIKHSCIRRKGRSTSCGGWILGLVKEPFMNQSLGRHVISMLNITEVKIYIFPY